MYAAGSTDVLDIAEDECAGPREKGRFPLLTAAMVYSKSGRRAASGHGVGMLITWLHKSAIAARNSMSDKAKEYFTGVVSATLSSLEDRRGQLDEQQKLWEQLAAAIERL